MLDPTPAVAVHAVHKTYGSTHALDGLDLVVPAGCVFGLLGPNGSGKTTAVRVLCTLARPDRGTAHVAGVDVVREPVAARRRLALAGQNAAVDEKLTGRENLRMFGRLHHLGARRARTRADELLDQFALGDVADRVVAKYSGGLRRRLDLAASLLVDPAVLFLDEPTTGLDPRARLEVWDAVRALTRGGTTVLLTTQYLDEADQLAGEIAVLDAGRVIATGSPDELKRRVGGDRIEIVVASADGLDAAAAALAESAGVPAHIDPGARRVSVGTADPATGLVRAVLALDARGVRVEDIGVRRATLDDVFLTLTGHRSVAVPDTGRPRELHEALR